MTKTQENRLSMYLTVQQVTNYFSDEWQGFTAYKNQFTEFETMIEKIQAIRAVQEGDITGVTQDKKDARRNLTNKGLEIAGKIHAYASVTGNNKLKKRVKFTRSQFSTCRDTTVIEYIRIIHSAAVQYATDLVDYDITPDIIDNLKTLYETFERSVENPRQAVTNRTKATVYLKQYFKESNIILKERLDKMMDYFTLKSPDFWLQYKSARKVIDLGHRKTGGHPVEEEAAAADPA